MDIIKIWTGFLVSAASNVAGLAIAEKVVAISAHGVGIVAGVFAIVYTIRRMKCLPKENS